MCSTFEDRLTFFMLYLVVTVVTMPVVWVLLMSLTNGAIAGGWVVMASNLFGVIFLMMSDAAASKGIKS